jgi:hypothetical protein
MKKQIDIEKILFPDSNKLMENGTVTIVDAELDPVECEFYNDGCVDINTEKYTYLKLTRENLCQLIHLIDKSETT